MSYHSVSKTPFKDTSILKCDTEGSPICWISWRDAFHYHLKNKIAWQVGETSKPDTPSQLPKAFGIKNIIGVRITQPKIYYPDHSSPRLSNHALFARDHHLCLYCGQQFKNKDLSRDHVMPKSRGGEDSWNNCVCACISCNQTKRDRTPEEAKMPLLALPYTPSHIEGLLLKNRKILANQMEFLLTKEPDLHEKRFRLSPYISLYH